MISEFAIISEDAVIGKNVRIHPHAIINAGVCLHDDVEIFSGAIIGQSRIHKKVPQELSFSENRVVIGPNTVIGPYSIVYANVKIGADTIIDGNCEIGYPTPLADGHPLIIGQGTLIRSHSVFYAGSCFGTRLVTGHRATVREKTIAGENLQIGTLCDIQGDCEIGDYVRFHSNVHVGKKSRIGNFVWLFPYVVLTNDPTPPSETLMGAVIEDYAVVATMSVILPGVTVGSHSLVGAHALVTKNVPRGMIVGGVPARVFGEASSMKLKDGSGQSAYPWTGHFHRGYPENITKEWNKMSYPEDFENSEGGYNGP
ncbi:MAG: N-acetyltransferase [Pseudomonadota bacterium]|nr:MAG: N-acetyltransferase [Desulfobacteraceae bacterium]